MFNDGLAHREGDRKEEHFVWRCDWERVRERARESETEERRVLRFKWMKSAPF